MQVDAGRPPNIIEIGHAPFMWQAFPDSTQFYSSWPGETSEIVERGRHIVSLSVLPSLARRLAGPGVDLIVVHAPAFSPWSGRALVRALFRRSMLAGNIAAFRGFGAELLRRRTIAPVAILDFEDAMRIERCNVFLLDRSALYFKRELPVDYWQVFVGTLHWRVPTPRFRALKKNRARIAKLRPISLGASSEVVRSLASPPPSDKSIDVFFAGRIRASATVRERGFEELRALQQEGYAIDVSDTLLPLDEYLKRCARAHLVWSPQGLGWHCFRTYEAAMCGAAPLCSRSGIQRYQPLIDGVHAIYYDLEPGALTHTIKAALADRDRLRVIGAAARQHALAFHTPAAIARHVVEATLDFGGRHATVGTGSC
jgi:hypothetical protein